MAISVKEKPQLPERKTPRRAGGYFGGGDAEAEAVAAGAGANTAESTPAENAAAIAGQGSGDVSGEVAAAEEAAAGAGKWSQAEKPSKKAKQAKAYGVRLPGLEEEFRTLKSAVGDVLAVDTARLVLVGSVAGLVALSEKDLSAAEKTVRGEMARRNRRKRERGAGDEPDYKAHLHSVRLGVVEADFKALINRLNDAADDLDTSNQVVIAAAMSLYLPASSENVEELVGRIRQVVSRERALEVQRKVAQGS